MRPRYEGAPEGAPEATSGTPTQTDTSEHQPIQNMDMEVNTSTDITTPLDSSRRTHQPEDLLGLLQGVRPTGDGWMALCPAHDDRNPSLSIKRTEDRLLIHCHAGCAFDAILDKLGLKACDLFDTPGAGTPQKDGAGTHPPEIGATVQPLGAQGLTLEQYAAARGLPIEGLRAFDLNDSKWHGMPAISIPYMDRSGAALANRYRIAVAGDRFRWPKGSKAHLYGLWKSDEAREATYVILVEGESDCHTLWANGFPAIGLPGADSWKEEWAEHLADIARIYVVVEPDKGGETVLKWLSKSSIRERCHLLFFDQELKDAGALYLSDPQGFDASFRERMDSAVSWGDYRASKSSGRQSEDWKRCSQIASLPDILAAFAGELRHSGVVGEEKTLKLLYLVFTSRLLERPVNAVLKGPSSVGKSYLMNSVLRFFPESAYFSLSGMSEHALAYLEEPMAHRHLVIQEQAGVTDDYATYLVRTLLSEGRIEYTTVVKTTEGLQSRTLRLDGPTGLVTTTTAPALHKENETRMLSIPVTDTPEQTRAVLDAQARAAMEPDRAANRIDFEAWRSLQDWLAERPARVLVPHAGNLVARIPPVANRLRRDVPSLLTLIKTQALLHQVNRETDPSGAIIATIDDYHAVRDLVAGLMSAGAEASVHATIRATVEAVRSLLEKPEWSESGATVDAVARELKLDKSAASRRARSAISLGYLVNLETKRGRPCKLKIGDPMPDDLELLPLPEDVASGCTVARDLGGMIAPAPKRRIRL